MSFNVPHKRPADDGNKSQRRSVEELTVTSDRTYKTHKVKVALTKAGVEVIWVEDAIDPSKDAYTHDLDVDVKNGGRISRELGIQALCLRRHESGINQTAKNPPDFRYSRKVFVRIVSVDSSTKESRRDVAERIAHVS